MKENLMRRATTIASVALGVIALSAVVVPAASAALAPAPRSDVSNTTRFLDRPKGRIAYEEAGPDNGQLVVLVPGIGDVRQQYRFLAPKLVAAGYRVITTDVRGLGESSTGWDDYTGAATGSDVVALLHDLNAGPAHLVGQSNAAGAVVWAAAEAPDLVRSLTLIGPFVRDIPPASFTDSAMTWGLINVGLARPWGVGLWGNYYSSLYPTTRPSDLDAYTQALQANLSEKGRLEAVQAMMQAPKSAVEARLDQVHAPALIVMGSTDPDFAGFVGGPAGEARYLADRLHGQVLMVEGAGHYPHTEMPEQVAPAILDHLAR
jgi:pimeloyl-ACP methyl ester carboxylesterase